MLPVVGAPTATVIATVAASKPAVLTISAALLVALLLRGPVLLLRATETSKPAAVLVGLSALELVQMTRVAAAEALLVGLWRR